MSEDTHGFEGISPRALEAWRAAAGPVGRPGPAWLTGHELAALWGVTRAAAYNRALRLLHNGLAERVTQQDGAGRQRAYFRLKEKP